MSETAIRMKYERIRKKICQVYIKQAPMGNNNTSIDKLNKRIDHYLEQEKFPAETVVFRSASL